MAALFAPEIEQRHEAILLGLAVSGNGKTAVLLFSVRSGFPLLLLEIVNTRPYARQFVREVGRLSFECFQF